MYFSLGLDTLKDRNRRENYRRFKEYYQIERDTLFLEIPIRELTDRFNFPKLQWQAGLNISFPNNTDTSYVISGVWYFED